MPRILVVDDDDMFRKMLCEVLERRGFSTLMAANGNEALQVLRGQKVDLAIIDIIMPEKEGIETICEILANTPGQKILAISGGSPHLKSEINLSLALRLGAHRILQKPFEQRELLEAISDLIGEVAEK